MCTTVVTDEISRKLTFLFLNDCNETKAAITTQDASMSHLSQNVDKCLPEDFVGVLYPVKKAINAEKVQLACPCSILETMQEF